MPSDLIKEMNEDLPNQAEGSASLRGLNNSASVPVLNAQSNSGSVAGAPLTGVGSSNILAAPYMNQTINYPSNIDKQDATEKRIVTMYQQSYNQAVQNQKKQDLQTHNRHNAIEQKMPALLSTNQNHRAMLMNLDKSQIKHKFVTQANLNYSRYKISASQKDLLSKAEAHEAEIS